MASPKPPQAPVSVVQAKDDLSTKEGIIAYIKTKDWDSHIATAIMLAESNASTTVVNWNDHHKGCDGSFSVMQVACIHFTKDQDPLDVKTNIDVAYEVYKSRGNFKDWSTFIDGKYRKYL